MKATFIEQFGGPEVLKYGDWEPRGRRGRGRRRCNSRECEGADWKVRSGQYSQAMFPLVLGRDFSGLVAAADAGIGHLKVGDAVFGVLEAGREGAYAEKLAIKAGIVAKKPDGLSHVNTAALALTGLTAISAIETTLQLKRGETILDSGRRRRGRELRHSACQVYRCPCDQHHERSEPGLCARPRRREVIDYNAQDFTKAGERLRRRVRYRRRRRSAKIVRGSQAGRPCRLHCLRRTGAEARSHRRDLAATGSGPRSGVARAHCPTSCGGSCTSARDQALSFIASRRGPSR